MDIIQYVIDYSLELISSGGIMAGFFLVFIESFIPALPLSVFVAFNVKVFGFFGGCLLSWIATCSGCFLCYQLFRYFDQKVTEKFLNRKMIQKVKKGIGTFQKITVSELVLLMTLPFTPSFLINILSGLSQIPREKFVVSLFIGKIFSIIFWGYIGKSILESIMDMKSIIYIVLTLGIAFIISKVVSKKMNIS